MKLKNKNEINNDEKKKIIYRGKDKIIPIKNPEPMKCEFYIIKKKRYCPFEKYKGR